MCGCQISTHSPTGVPLTWTQNDQQSPKPNSPNSNKTRMLTNYLVSVSMPSTGHGIALRQLIRHIKRSFRLNGKNGESHRKEKNILQPTCENIVRGRNKVALPVQFVERFTQPCLRIPTFVQPNRISDVLSRITRNISKTISLRGCLGRITGLESGSGASTIFGQCLHLI